MTTLEWIALGILVGVWLMTWVLWALTNKAEELVRLIRFLPENLVEAWEEQRRRRRHHAELRQGGPHRIVDQRGMVSARHIRLRRVLW